MGKPWTQLMEIIVLGLAASTAQAETMTYHATLNGASEVPPVQTAAIGNASIEIDMSGNALGWLVDFSGLSSAATAAEIHCGALAGRNAGVSVSLALPGLPLREFESPNLGTMPLGLNKAQLADLQAGRCYIQIPTVLHKDGEIRGQLTP
jgi:CHRD domain